MTPKTPATPTNRTAVLGFALALLAGGGLLAASESASLAFVGGLAMGACLPALFWGLQLSSLYEPELEVEQVRTNVVAYAPPRRGRMISSVYATTVTLSVLAIVVIGDSGNTDAQSRAFVQAVDSEQPQPATPQDAFEATGLMADDVSKQDSGLPSQLPSHPDDQTHKAAVRTVPPDRHATDSPDLRRQAVIADLESPIPKIKRYGAKLAIRYYHDDEKVLAVAAKELAQGYMKENDGIHEDAMAWICKLLGVSGDEKYKPLLSEIAAKAPGRRLRQHAAKAAAYL